MDLFPFQLIEYNDTDDDGLMTAKDARLAHKLDSLHWQDANATIQEVNSMVTLTSNMSALGENAMLSLHVSI